MMVFEHLSAEKRHLQTAMAWIRKDPRKSINLQFTAGSPPRPDFG